MPKTSLLPSTVRFEQLIYELNLDHLPRITAVDCIFGHVQDGNLKLYFDTQLTAIEESVEGSAIKSTGDGFLELETTPPNKGLYRAIYHRKTFYIYGDYKNLILENSVVIEAFMQEGISFLTHEEYRNNYHPEISYEDIYCDGEELKSFINNQKQDETTNKKVILKTSQGKISKQDRREEAFKQWLATKAERQITADSQYQECYVKIEEPTRDCIWSSLQKVDRRLFAQGKDDFFKKQNIINFTKGTGEHRYKQS